MVDEVSGIKLGHALITMVEPHPETLLRYNRWYERDHFYSGMLTGPWTFAGRRFVATRDLKALRVPSESPIAQPATLGSFIALYWIEAGHLSDQVAWAFPEAARLGEQGRMNTDRDHVSTSVYDLLDGPGPGDDGVPPELALDHPYDGLVVAWIRPDTGAGSVLGSIRRHFDAAIRRSPYEQVIGFVPVDFPGMPGPIMPGAGAADRLVVCFFLNAAPTVRWGLFTDLAAKLGDSGEAGVELLAPFVPVIPGTDRYLDELW